MAKKGFDLQTFIDNSPANIQAEQQRAYEVHAQIISGTQTAQQGLFQMAQGFKTMRDEKLFRAMGYDTFADYCEKETGISRSMVYRYITIVEKLPSDLSTRVDKLGTRKLELLTSLSDEQREEVIAEVDVESATVKELREKIAELTDSKEKAEKEAEKLRSRSFEDTDQYISLKNANTALEMLRKSESEKVEKLKAELETAEQKKTELETQLEEMAENTSSPDVTQTEEYRQLARSRGSEMQAANDKIERLNEQITALNSTIRELESRPVEVAVESNEKDKEEIIRLEAELEKAQREITSARSDITRLEDKAYKAFMFRMSAEEFKELVNYLESHRNDFVTDFVGIFKSGKILPSV